MIVGRHGEEESTTAQVLITTVDTESDPVEMDSVDVVTKLSDVLTCVAVRVGKTTQEAIDLKSGYSEGNFVALESVGPEVQVQRRGREEKNQKRKELYCKDKERNAGPCQGPFLFTIRRNIPF